ncbi:hypothetical protein V22_24270 [Calycomorphotria hydatis]|uniref:Uncharacterized protein n=1 Tax=Calycomorphotria hydatis TaxID=2528027 RepID=A0A517T9X5_9PLAN|nr:hypothetical protein V22_24270 [Calycomorphotria hydatis]
MIRLVAPQPSQNWLGHPPGLIIKSGGDAGGAGFVQVADKDRGLTGTGVLPPAIAAVIFEVEDSELCENCRLAVVLSWISSHLK